GGDAIIDEDDLDQTGTDMDGSDTPTDPNAVTGDFSISSPDGVQSLTVGGIAVVSGGVVQGFPASTTTPLGNTLTITGFDGTTVNYSYTLNANETHSAAGEDSIFEDFAVSVVDPQGDSDSDTLSVQIVDDVATAMDDTNGTSAGGTVGGDVVANDVTGADGITGVVGAQTAADYAGGDLTNGVGVLVSTKGTLTLNGDGTYSYTANADATGDDVFYYTVQDGDGDLSTAILTITVDSEPMITNLTPKGDGGDAIIDEDDLDQTGTDMDGSDTPTDPNVVTGDFNVSSPDGIQTLTVGGIAVVTAGVVQSFPASVTTPLGNTLTITGFDGTTVSYSYTLNANETHSAAGEDSVFEDFAVSLVDPEGDSDSDTLSVQIVDDVATAMDDTNGTSAGGTVGGDVVANDVTGADGITGVVGAQTAVDYAGGDLTNGVGVLVSTKGTLTLNADGTYSYTANADATGDDVFYYTVQDGDGDLSTAILTITVDSEPMITNLTPKGDGGDAIIDEDDLDQTGTDMDGSDTPTDPNAVTGDFSISSPDGVQSLTVGGIAVVSGGVVQGFPASTTTPLGNTLTITGFDGSTVSYSYTLNANETHSVAGEDSIFEDFAVSVVDPQGDSDSDTLSVQIVDDVATAYDDGTIATLNEPAVGVNLGSAASLLLANDEFGADGLGASGISLVSPTGSAGGTITINGDGDLIYTNDIPNGQSVLDTFSYTITDGDGDVSAPATFSVSLTDVNEPPTINVNVGEDEVYEAYLTGGSGLPAGVSTPLTASGTITLADSDGLDSSVSIRVGGVSGDVVTMTALLSLEASGTPITLSNADVEYGQLQLTGYNSGTGEVQWQYTLQTNVDNDDAQEVLDGATDTLDLDDFTVEISDDAGATWVGPATGTVKVYDDEPVFSADGTLLISAPDNSLNIADIVDWTFGADGYASVSSDSGSAVVASQTADGVVINLLDSEGVVVGILTLNADGTDSLEVIDRPADIIQVPLSSASVSAGGPQPSYVLNDATTGLVTTVSGNDLVNPSTQGWAISDNQVDPGENILFSFAGPAVQNFTFMVEGITGGGDKMPDVAVTVTYDNGTTTLVNATFGDGGVFDSTNYAAIEAAIDGGRTISSVRVASAEPDKGNGFRLNNVSAGATSSEDPDDLNFNFTLDIVDGDGDVASQDFDITLQGAEDGSFSVTTATPITIDLGNDGVEYVSREAGIVFTDQVTGEVVNTAWIGADDGLLVFDADNSGTVNEAKEFVFTEWSETARTDMEAVAEVFDTNKDGVLDAQDEQFSQFAVWQDADGDGVTDAGELTSLVDLGVQSIALNYAEDSQSGSAADGDVFIHGQSTVTWTDGSTSTADDASFAQDPLDLKDLIGDSEEAELSSFLNVSFDGTNTIVEVSNSGSFEGNAGDADKVDHTVTFEGIDLVTGHDDMASIIQNMLDSGKLTVDQ
ncbi:type I secretion C-terminal target domain-containing protein, partial [Parahaliea maris]